MSQTTYQDNIPIGIQGQRADMGLEHRVESFLAEAFDLESKPLDPFEEAIAETEDAIQSVQSGKSSIDLRPVGSAIRRYQHQMARQANLVSHSYGKGRNRHVRIFSTPLN